MDFAVGFFMALSTYWPSEKKIKFLASIYLIQPYSRLSVDAEIGDSNRIKSSRVIGKS